MFFLTATFVLTTNAGGLGFWPGVFWAVVGVTILSFVIGKLFAEYARLRRSDAAQDEDDVASSKKVRGDETS